MKLYIYCYTGAIAPNVVLWQLVKEVSVFRKYSTGHSGTYTSLTKLLAWQARPGTTHDGNGTKAETYSSISATNQHQLRQKTYQ